MGHMTWPCPFRTVCHP